MSELFRSALGLLGGGQGDRGSDFVGSQVELGEMKLRVKRVIAEGEFQMQYLFHDIDVDFLLILAIVYCSIRKSFRMAPPLFLLI